MNVRLLDVSVDGGLTVVSYFENPSRMIIIRELNATKTVTPRTYEFPLRISQGQFSTFVGIRTSSC